MENRKVKWYKTNWFMIVLFLFIPYIAIFVYWKRLKNKNFKIILSIWAVSALFIAFTNKPQNNTQAAVKNNSKTAHPTTYQKLTIDSVSVNKGNIVVNGSTDLPDQAKVTVWFGLANKENYQYGSDVMVKSGHYSATLAPPPIKELQKGPYNITVVFFVNSQNQSASIIKLVGQHGEKLKGKYAKSEQLGGTQLEIIETVNLNLPIHPQKPSENTISSAYLKQYLSFMNDYYKGMKSRNEGSDKTDWFSYVAGENQKGEAMYQKINDATNLQEDSTIFQAGSDATQAWVYLKALEDDYNNKIFGDGILIDKIKGDEDQFAYYYNQAIKEAGTIK